MLRLPTEIIVVDFIDSIIDNIRDTYSIDSITNVGTTYTINTADTKDIANNDYVTINSVSYKISNLVADTSFDVTSLTSVTGSSWKADAPYYYYGTPIATGNTRNIDKLDGILMKYPFIAVLEPFDSEINLDTSDIIYKTANLWMVFMTESNPNDWNTEQHYTNAINNMTTLLRTFMLELVKSGKISELEGYTETNHSEWGLIAKNSGSTKTIFNENLSGVEITNFKLPLLKKYSC